MLIRRESSKGSFLHPDNIKTFPVIKQTEIYAVGVKYEYFGVKLQHRTLQNFVILGFNI